MNASPVLTPRSHDHWTGEYSCAALLNAHGADLEDEAECLVLLAQHSGYRLQALNDHIGKIIFKARMLRESGRRL
jgi:hypothetical protein